MNTISTTDKICFPEIHFAPLQGYTDMVYISVYSLYFKYIDFYYTSFYSVEDDLSESILKIPERIFSQIVPQVLPANIAEMKLLTAFVMQNNFSKINVNMGCPYSMVTRKGRGAYLIKAGKIVADIIDYIHDYSPLEVSVKTRLGLIDETEILGLLDILAYKEIKSVIIHPRTASQLYKGEISALMFQKCKALFPNIDFIYNGDIIDLKNFRELRDLFVDQRKWMIGRGLLSNPFLAGQIKGIMDGDEMTQKTFLYKFIVKLIEEIEHDSKDKGHALNRIKVQFQYLSNAFENPQKTSRIVKKIKSASEVEKFLIKEFKNLFDGSV